jgi:hypothetical protein
VSSAADLAREDVSSRRQRSEEWPMLPFWIFLAFMGCLIVGSLIANALGVLPTAEEQEQQDQARMTKIERSQ